MSFSKENLQTAAESLKASVMDLLSRHVGSRKAITAAEMCAALGLRGKYADRPVRAAIQTLRREGHLIVSSVGNTPGYYIAETEDEWLEFRDRNLRPRALDILETSRAMGQAAQQRWGPARQLSIDWDQQLEVVA